MNDAIHTANNKIEKTCFQHFLTPKQINKDRKTNRKKPISSLVLINFHASPYLPEGSATSSYAIFFTADEVAE